jgi:hypothetical protein
VFLEGDWLAGAVKLLGAGCAADIVKLLGAGGAAGIVKLLGAGSAVRTVNKICCVPPGI